MTRALAGAALLLVAHPRLLAAQEVEPPTVDSIVIITHNVFDEQDARANFLFRLANALHVRTRTSVVRQELLFRQGEPFDSARVTETLRNLRNRGLFRDVRIDTLRQDGRLIAVVQTADGWTTSLVLNARSTGGEFSWALGGEERNFLGTATSLGLVYRDEPDRSSVTVRAGQYRVGGTRLAIEGVYENLSDGTVGQWGVALPFRSLSERTGTEFVGAAVDRRALQFRDGVLDQAYRHTLLTQRASFAYAPVAGPLGYLRVGARAAVKREEFVREQDSLLPLSDSVTATFGGFAEFMRARFKVVTHFNGFARPEDLDLSTRFSAGVYAALPALGYPSAGIGPFVGVQAGFDAGRVFGRLSARANGLFDGSGLDSGQVMAGLTIGTQLVRRNATVLHVQAGARKRPPPGAEFDLGHGLGPRGFQPHAFTGDRTIWGTLEHRVFAVDEFFGLLGVGFAAFFDYGGAWYDGQAMRFGGDVGVGLRLGATRATGTNVGRLDLAYRFGAGFGGGRRWVLSFGRSYPF